MEWNSPEFPCRAPMRELWRAPLRKCCTVLPHTASIVLVKTDWAIKIKDCPAQSPGCENI